MNPVHKPDELTLPSNFGQDIDSNIDDLDDQDQDDRHLAQIIINIAQNNNEEINKADNNKSIKEDIAELAKEEIDELAKEEIDELAKEDKEYKKMDIPIANILSSIMDKINNSKNKFDALSNNSDNSNESKLSFLFKDIGDLIVNANNDLSKYKERKEKEKEKEKEEHQAEKKADELIYTCYICNSEHKNMFSYNDHIAIYHENDFIDEPYFSCNICGNDYNSEHSYLLHMDTHRITKKVVPNNQDNQDNNELSDPEDENENEDEDEHDHEPLIDDIPTSINGQFICPICSKKYATQNHVGEHFAISHTSYEDQLHLESTKQHGGFPGLEILKHIEMFDYLNDDKEKELLENDECNICAKIFNIKVRNFDNNVTEMLESGYYSDSDIIESRYSKALRKCENYIFSCDMRTKDTIEITDNEILQTGKIRRPLKLLCCDNIICSDCLEEYVKHSRDIKCMYCNKDHNNNKFNNEYDNGFVTFKTPGNYNKNAWLTWWKKHADIFYP
jgi:hypothetical protein